MCRNIGKILLSGAIFAAIGVAINTVVAMLTTGYYKNPDYFAVWSKMMMPTAGPPPVSFTIYSLLFLFIGGVLFALVYDAVKKSVKRKSTVETGLFYGLLVFLVAGIPSSLSLILLINLPLELIITWALSELVGYLIGGIVTAKLIK